MTLPLYNTLQQQEPTFFKESHAGLWFDRFFNAYETNFSILKSKKINNKDQSPRSDWLIKSFTKEPVGITDELTRQAQNQITLTETLGGQNLVFKSFWHFVTGLGTPHPVETGFAWHATLGVPYLTGAAVKGLVRSYFENSYEEADKEELLWQWFGNTNKDSTKQTKTYPSRAGEVIFFDAIPVQPVTLSVDVMTPHMGDWYESGDKVQSISKEPKVIPADWHDPVPVTFLVAKNITLLFSFALRPFERSEGDTRKSICLDNVTQVLSAALQYAGAGAKTATGYGAFDSSPETLKEHAIRFKELLSKWKNDEETSRIDRMCAEDQKLFKLKKLLDNDKQKNFKQAGGLTAGSELAKLLEEGKTWEFEHRVNLAELAEAIYNWHGWGPKRKIDSKKAVLASLRIKL